MSGNINSEPISVIPTKSDWKGWGNLAGSIGDTPNSLEVVMSEQLAMHLQDMESKENKNSETDFQKNFDSFYSGQQSDANRIISEDFVEDGNIDTSSDFLIASMLQFQLDTEHDRLLRKIQDKWNGTNKVTVSFENYRSVHPALQADADFNEDLLNVADVKIKKDISPCFNKQGISGKGKNIITKHDPLICSRKNTTKVMENFPPEFETGNDLSFDMRLPNHVYNQLKVNSNIESKRRHKNHEKKEHSTRISAVDAKTRLILYKLVSSGALTSIDGIIKSGKESVVFHAYGGNMNSKLVPVECAVKVFKTTLSSFKNRCEYVRGDVRFFKDEFKKLNPRKILKIWAEKEEVNLKRMQKFGVNCPTPVVLKNHVLVLSFIGKDQKAAPTLQEAMLSETDMQKAFDQCFENMNKMYNDCKLVHADLSEFNMLWWNEILYFIDVAQTVDISHPKALHFLTRDCQQVIRFFSKHLQSGILSWQELFNKITGLSLTGFGEEFLTQIQQSANNEATLRLGMSKNDYSFDYFFDRSCQERKNNNKMKNDDSSDNNDDDCDLNNDDDEEEEDESEETVVDVENNGDEIICLKPGVNKIKD